jgi:hypothetical protein
MSHLTTKDICPYCKAIVAGGVEGCVSLFNEILTLEYTNPEYGAVHLLTCDAHPLQHSEIHGKKNNPFHLLRLCWLLEHNGDPKIGQGPRWLQNHFNGMPELPILIPPTDRGKMTVVDVHKAKDAKEHAQLVKQWGISVWQAWNTHHQWARQTLIKILNL